MKIGFMQGRLVPSEKKNSIQYFPSKNWIKEIKIAKENKLNCMEWTANIENIKKNPIFQTKKIKKTRSILKKNNIKVVSLTCDFYMQKPSFKSSNPMKEIELLKKILINGENLGIKLFIIPLVDNSSLKNSSEEKKLIEQMIEISKKLKKKSKILFEIDYPPKKVLRFIRKFPKNFGINYDTGNSASLNYTFHDEKKYFSYVENIHIKDRKKNGKTVRLGKGNWKFKTFFKYLKKIKYNGNLILQTARSNDNKDLKEILQNKLFIRKYL